MLKIQAKTTRFKADSGNYVVGLSTNGGNQREYWNKELNTNYKSFDAVDWYDISSNHPLSEDFIREFADKVNWKRNIPRTQKLSEKFIFSIKGLSV